MSLEEDTELRDIVLETLDQRGVVGKAKVQILVMRVICLKYKCLYEINY